MLYLLLGKKRYYELRDSGNIHTCSAARDVDLPFFSHMLELTDVHEHLVTLYMLSVRFGLRTIVELGTRAGESTLALTSAAKRCNGKVYSFDLNACPVAAQLIAENGLGEFWEFKKGDDLETPWDRPIDHLYIDTSHTYEHTLRELEKFEPFVQDGGVISMHDSVSFPSVRDSARTYFKSRMNVDVYEYINNNGLIVVFKDGIKRKTSASGHPGPSHQSRFIELTD